MKLIMCPLCKDLFRLRTTLRNCECGHIKGKYIDNRNAEVSKEAISIAIGNGSLLKAINKMNVIYKNSKGEADRNVYRDDAKIEHVWVRPNSGSGNPNTEILKKMLENKNK